MFWILSPGLLLTFQVSFRDCSDHCAESWPTNDCKWSVYFALLSEYYHHQKAWVFITCVNVLAVLVREIGQSRRFSAIEN
jgi:hypothetical protein